MYLIDWEIYLIKMLFSKLGIVVHINNVSIWDMRQENLEIFINYIVGSISSLGSMRPCLKQIKLFCTFFGVVTLI